MGYSEGAKDIMNLKEMLDKMEINEDAIDYETGKKERQLFPAILDLAEDAMWSDSGSDIISDGVDEINVGKIKDSDIKAFVKTPAAQEWLYKVIKGVLTVNEG